MYKSPGIDQIPAEVIQAGGNTLSSEIHKLINSIWNKEGRPQQWKKSITTPIYGKDAETDLAITEEYHSYQPHTKFYSILLSQD